MLLLKGNAEGDKASGLTSPLTDTTCEILPVFWKTCQAGFKLVTSCVAEQHSSNWANRVAFNYYYYYYFYHLYHHHHYQYHYHYCGLLLSPTISRLLLHMPRMYVSSIVWTFCHSQSDHLCLDNPSRKTCAKHSAGAKAFWPSIVVDCTPQPLIITSYYYYYCYWLACCLVLAGVSSKRWEESPLFSCLTFLGKVSPFWKGHRQWL